MTGDFINGSTATGLLNIVYSLINSSVVRYSFAPISIQHKIEDVILELPSDYYGVSVYIVLDNGLPFPRVAVRPSMVQVHDTHETVIAYPSVIVHELLDYSSSSGTCITCTFLDRSCTNCVVVVHQRISQLSSNGLMNIESSHKFNRSGDTAYGCIKDVNLSIYQIGAVGGVDHTKSVTSMSSIIISCYHTRLCR